MIASILGLFALSLLAPALHRVFRDRTGYVLAAGAAAAFAFFAGRTGAVRAGPPDRASWDWVEGLGLRFSFQLDGLGLLFAFLITGVGVVVLVHAAGYLRGDPRLSRFHAAMLFFMAAMLGLVLADDVLLLFLFWELTSVSSYILIGFGHEKREARDAALQALLVTGAGGLALLAGLVFLGHAAGTFQVSEMAARADAIRAHPHYLPALLLILLGAFTKSAQFPFHFWLPGAMVAPSPVSAYLHSATMVKAGVYLLARLNPVLGGTDAWHYLIMLAGASTLLAGAVLSVAQNDLKRLFAYTTVSALGTLTLLVGIGTELAAKAAMVFLLVHALYKAALFLAAGTIDHETGTRDRSRLGGLLRSMPLTSAALGVSALSMAGLPPLFGFIAKELFYEAKFEAPRAAGAITAVGFVGSALVVTAAIMAVRRPLFGRPASGTETGHEGPLPMWVGPLGLAAASTALGLFPRALAEPLIQPAASALYGEPLAVKLALWHGINPVFLLSLATLALGAAIYLFRRRLLAVAAPARRLARWGPARTYEILLAGTLAAARGQTRVLQNGVLGIYLLFTVGGAVALGGITFLRDLHPFPIPAGDVRLHELAVAVAMAAGAVAVVRARTILFAVAALGVVGYGVALTFLFFGGPDLAMTQFSVETLSVMLFVLVLRRLPPLRNLSPRSELLRDGAVAVATGAFMTALTLAAAAQTRPTLLRDFLAAASVPEARGRNIVNVILVDFRGLDTLGEITVLAAAAIGVLALLRLVPGEGSGKSEGAP